LLKNLSHIRVVISRNESPVSPHFGIRICLISASRNRAIDALLAPLTYRDFWKMITDFSDPDGALNCDFLPSMSHLVRAITAWDIPL